MTFLLHIFSYVTARGHALIDRALYLPQDWCEDADRRSAAHIPESVRFRTKPELAAQMVERVNRADLPICWVVADTVYGGNVDLRSWLETHQYHYVLAVACNEPVAFQAAQVRRREEAALVETFLSDQLRWYRLSMSEGTKGPRLFDWALVPMFSRWQDDGRHFLLIRRSLTNPQEKCYYFVFAPVGLTLSELVAAIGCRWCIEEDFEIGKGLGLDQYEVRTWIGWYRHVTLMLLAEAFLTGICAHCAHCAHDQTTKTAAQGNPPQEERPLSPLTRPEVAHLLGQLIWPHPHNVPLLFAWSWWRRYHRSRASYYQSRRRLKAG